MAAQLMAMYGPDARSEALWMALASNSFPVPLSPVMTIAEFVFAIFRAIRQVSTIAWLSPMMSSNVYFAVYPRFSSRRRALCCRSSTSLKR